MKTYQNTSSDTTLENILQTQAHSSKTQSIFGAFSNSPTHMQDCPWDVSRLWDGPAAWWTARKGTTTCSGPVLGGRLGHLWWPNTLPAACLAMGCRAAAAAGLGGEEPCMAAGQESRFCTTLLDCNCSASQRSQTSAVHRHDPTQRRAHWRASEKPLFHRKIPFRHFLFLVLIVEFHLQKFLTAHAVSSAWAVFPGQLHRACLKCFSISNKQDTCSATGVRNQMQQGLELKEIIALCAID